MFSFSAGDLSLHSHNITNALHALIYVAEGIKWIEVQFLVEKSGFEGEFII